MQRNCLFRGVIVDDIAARRKGKLVELSAVLGQEVSLDWYNVLITVESYLKGDILFVSDDGIVRDASAVHGSYRTGPLTERAMEEVLAEISHARPSRVTAYLDQPIAFSGLMADGLRSRMAGMPFVTEVALAPSADFHLKGTLAVVATSDSAVLDSCARAVDLARAVLEHRFGFNPPAIHDLFPESHESPLQ
jgi:hypothetical protein